MKMPTEYSQKRLDERFDREAKSWRERYEVVNDRPWRYNDKLYRRQYTLELLGERGGQILDLGCGAGPYFGALRRLGYQVVGMDTATEMLQLANEEAAKQPEDTWVLRGDALNLPFQDDTFDAILAVGLLEYLPDDRDFLEKLKRVLKPGGRAVITLRNETCFERNLWKFYKKCGFDIYGATYWYREHRPDEFEEMLAGFGFENIERRYCHFYPMTWPFFRLLRPLNAIAANAMERRFSQSELDWLASTYVVGFDKPGHRESRTLRATEFSKLLRCPITNTPLREGEAEELEKLNERLVQGEVKTKGGQRIEGKIAQGYVSEDGSWLYPVIDSVPCLLADQAIPL